MDIFAEQIKGLTSAQVEERLRRGDRNKFAQRPTRTYSQILKSNIFNLYNIILLGSFLVLLVLRGLGASIFPAAVVLTNMILGIVQEIRAKRALDKLAAQSIRMVSVRREGQGASVPVDSIVRDEVIELTPGESVVVDGPILASDSLEMDESQLTGESEYVPKQPGERVLSGSFCVSGRGLMQAENIGSESFVNNLVQTARAYKSVRTPLERQLDVLLKWLILIMAVLAPLTLLNGLVRGISLAESFENVVNLISSLVPQGLIVFVAISFAYGVIRIARFKALIQRPNAIESMGHVTCLCADKTGTLTQNLLVVKEIIPLGDETDQTVREKLGIYTCSISWQNRTVAAIAAAVKPPVQPSNRVAEIPFNSDRKWSSIFLSSGETFLLGAPELLLKNPREQSQTQELSRQGLRVVVLADSDETLNPGTPSLPSQWTNVALVALQDQLRPDICDTLNDFARQGVAIKIISGDSPDTVMAIARQACMDATGVLAGTEIDAMDESQLDSAVQNTDLFARIAPQSKRRVIRSLAKQGYIAMIGDGVNDVPALKQAHIAIAMNDGAQIARDVADITLLNNAFSTLPSAFREGRELTRRIYAIAKINLVKVVYLTIMFVLTGFIGYGWPANLIQTTWLSLVTLTVPALLIIFRLLPVPPGENEPRQFLRYILTWGVIGSAALMLMQVIVQTGFRQDLVTSRTMVIAFAGIFNSIVLWDVYGVSPISPASLMQNWKPAIAGLVLGAVSALVPVYLIPASLGFKPLGWLQWLVMLFCLLLAHAAVWLMRVRPPIVQKAVPQVSAAGDPVPPDHPGHLDDQRDNDGNDQNQ